jgi:hypothetical protein
VCAVQARPYLSHNTYGVWLCEFLNSITDSVIVAHKAHQIILLTYGMVKPHNEQAASDAGVATDAGDAQFSSRF